MDSILTDFIGRTHADPAFAQDLLDAADWNMEAALALFDGLKDTRAVEPEEYHYDPKDFEQPTANESDDHAPEWEGQDGASINSSVLGSITEGVRGGGSNIDENEAQRQQIVKRQRRYRGRGLSFLAGDVVDKFTKVAISKLKVSSKEQMMIDEKFFHHSFSYPDFSGESDELQEFIANDLLETAHKKALERSGRLNWWTTTGKLPRLEPLATSGDGNCLLHAASLYMWGFHDRQLILRTALHRMLTTSREGERIRRRWRYQTQLRNNEAGGLTFSEEEWDFEWGEIVRISTNQPRRQPTTASLRRYSTLRFSYESLEEIHIFALAHVLRRPIIVIADSAIKNLTGEDLAPIYFGGIYLPLEINATACSRTPVVLAYDASHFSPLVARRDTLNQQPRVSGKFSRLSSRTETIIPLVSPTGALLPVQFIIDPKNRQVAEKWGEMKYSPGEFPDEIIHLLDHYLKIRWIQLNVTSVTQSTDQDYDHLFPVQVPKVRFPAAVIFQDTQPIYQKELIEKYLENIRDRYAEEKERLAERERERERRLQEVPVPCEGAGCDMFGKGATNNLCSKCYQKLQKAKAGGERETGDMAEEERGGVKVGSGKTSYPEIVQEHKLENGSDQQFNASYPPPPNHPPPNLPPKGVTRKQLPPVQPPPKQCPSKQLPPIQAPPSRPPPVYSASASYHDDSSDDLHRSKHQCDDHPNRSPPSTASGLQHSRTDRKSSTSHSATSDSNTESSTATSGSKSKQRSSPGHSTVEENSGKDKQWTKKFNLFTNLSPFSKPTAAKGRSGYTRDSIQPIKLADGGVAQPSTLVSGPQRIKCVNSGCEFFGCAETKGYCSSCFKEIQQHGPIVAV